MTESSPNTISLEEHARRVKEGEIFKETLRNGDSVEFRARPPKQGHAFNIQRVLQDVISANPELLAVQAAGGELRLTDPGVIIRMQELDSKCLVACVEGLDEDNVMYYAEQLHPECLLLQRVKELCGVSVFNLEEDSEGN